MVCVAAGKEHALALTRNDDIWAWGSNEYGQLGLPQSHQEHGERRTGGGGVRGQARPARS